MDFDPKDIVDFLRAAAQSIGAEVTSPWFYLQFGLMLAAVGVAFLTDTAIRSRVDMSSLGMRWPLPLRHFARVLVASASTAVFAALVIAARITMFHSTWPSRSYMLMVAAKLALAWLLIRLVASVIRNAFIVKLVSITAWLIAALSILGQLRFRRRCPGFRSGCGRARRAAADAAASDQGRRAVDPRAVADQHRRQFRREPDQPLQRPDAVDPGAAGQDDPLGADGGRDRDRARRGRHQPVGACGLHRRGRRRHRPRPAEDRRQLHQPSRFCWSTNR